MEQPPSQLTAAAVRAELARRRLSGRQLGQAVGWSPATTSRKVNGVTPLTVDELPLVASFIGVPVSALLPDRQPAA